MSLTPAPNFCVKILIPNVMMFGGEVFGKSLGPWGGALMNGSTVLTHRDMSDVLCAV